MPLKARWTHGIMALSNDREGCHSPVPPSSSCAAAGTFCPFNARIDAILSPLHVQLRAGARHVQKEIDRYIVACSTPQMQHMVLLKHTIPHYDNLPDIQNLAIGILDTSADLGATDFQQIFLLMRQCTPLRRRTKRAQREVQWRPGSFAGMQILIRCTLGTLMGLYPSCTRPVAFAWRVRIYAFIRTLLVQPFEILNQCMAKIRYVCKLCIMEHICNTVSDYYPGIFYILNKNGCQMQSFSKAVATMCDLFRNDINGAFTAAGGDVLATFRTLDTVAKSLFERCTRSFRGAIINPDSHRRLCVQKRIPIASLVSDSMFQFVSDAYLTRTQYVFRSVHADIIPAELMDAVWAIMQNVRIFDLPRCVQERQYEAICKAHFMDHARIRARQLVHICIFCAFKHGTSCCRKRVDRTDTILTYTKFRVDCQTQQLLCVACNSQSVIAINLLGRILQLGRTLIVLSACCGTIVRYTGSGREFCTTCGLQCAPATPHTAQTSKKAKKALCRVCHQRGVQQTLQVLDVPSRSIVTHTFCGRHRIPEHLRMTIFDTRELHAVMNTLPSLAGGASSRVPR